MSLTKKQRYEFRKSNKWRRFRLECKKKSYNIDFITNRVLTRTWNLHHLDMRSKNYDNLENISRFMPLNKDTHEFLHWLYRVWRKDKKVIERLEYVLNKMEEYNND